MPWSNMSSGEIERCRDPNLRQSLDFSYSYLKLMRRIRSSDVIGLA